MVDDHERLIQFMAVLWRSEAVGMPDIKNFSFDAGVCQYSING
jgi:hypothetical protein